MSFFPTETDLAFYNVRRMPAWAERIERPNQYRGPSIDDVVNAHAGLRFKDTESHNICVLVRGWLRRGESVRDRLIALASYPTGVNPRKRASLARKWARRIP